MPGQSVKLFLSCVSDEFGGYRDVLRKALTRPNVEVKIPRISRRSAATRCGCSKSTSSVAKRWCISPATWPARRRRRAASRTCSHAGPASKPSWRKRAFRVRRSRASPTRSGRLARHRFRQGSGDRRAGRGCRARRAAFKPTDASRASQANHLKRLRAINIYRGRPFTNADNLVAQSLLPRFHLGNGFSRHGDPRSHSRAGCDNAAEMAAADHSLTR